MIVLVTRHARMRANERFGLPLSEQRIRGDVLAALSEGREGTEAPPGSSYVLFQKRAEDARIVWTPDRARAYIVATRRKAGLSGWQAKLAAEILVVVTAVELVPAEAAA